MLRCLTCKSVHVVSLMMCVYAWLTSLCCMPTKYHISKLCGYCAWDGVNSCLSCSYECLVLILLPCYDYTRCVLSVVLHISQCWALSALSNHASMLLVSDVYHIPVISSWERHINVGSPGLIHKRS